LARRISPRWVFSVEYLHDVSDSSEVVTSELSDQFSAGGEHNAEITAGPVRLDAADARLFKHGGRLQAAIQGWWSDERNDVAQVENGSNRRGYGMDVRFDYKLSPLWTLEGRGRTALYVYQSTGERLTNTSESLAMSRKIGPSMYLRLNYVRLQGESIFKNSFVENRAVLEISYAPNQQATSFFDPAGQFRYSDISGEQGFQPLPGSD